MSVDDSGPAAPEDRAAALRRWAEENGYGEKRQGGGTLASDTSVGGTETNSRPPEEASPSSGEDVSDASGPERDTEAAAVGAKPDESISKTATDEEIGVPLEFQEAKNRGKNNSGEKMKDVVFIMTETEMSRLAAGMARLQRAFGTRNVASTLLRTVEYAERYVDLSE